MDMTRENWGSMPDGRSIELYTLANDVGMEVSVSTYGGVVTRLTAPDRDGRMADITLGYDSLSEYLDDCCYFGCIVGRVANRIGNARFTLDGGEYELDRNQGDHHLHGGIRGFHTHVWDAVADETPDGPRLRLTRTSPDGEQGYPGTLIARVDYTLTANGLRLEFSAEADKPTVVNMTNHSYFNLSGDSGSDCLNHELTIPASRYLETDAEQIPTGVLADVADTPMDFRAPSAIGSRISEEYEALGVGQGYDHYYVLDADAEGMKLCGAVYEPLSGRCMEVLTTYPGVHFYSGNHVSKSLAGKGGIRYGTRCGFCLEAHGYVDAPNNAAFPAVTLRPGENRSDLVEYAFCTR